MGTQAAPRLAQAGEVETTSGFWLKKWYLDACNERGDVYIGYWAQAHWKALSLHYYEHLWRTPAIGVASKSAFAARAGPAWRSPTCLAWETPECRAEWTSVEAQELSENLLETRHGSVRWHCFQPKARVEVRLPDLSFRGWGYSESIEVTLRPWQLPLKRLYWGRAHSEHHYLVWIKWDGPTSESILWHNGRRTTDFEVSDTGLRAASIQLDCEQHSTLRKGVIRSTVFRSLGKVASLVPAKALLVDEHKMFGTGRILIGRRSEPATAIYEEVIW